MGLHSVFKISNDIKRIMSLFFLIHINYERPYVTSFWETKGVISRKQLVTAVLSISHFRNSEFMF